MKCFYCSGPRKTGSHYFCLKCFRELFEKFGVSCENLEEYLNYSYRDVVVFSLEGCDDPFRAYEFIRTVISDIKPLPNLVEYILLYKLMYCLSHEEFKSKV
jgi:hypothetical protein